jgi:2-polyprenyl-3-methyl-5-hydroxy-6-metoxy-1,4-benzoquinol methylase
MTDLFADKAADWDSRPVPLQISTGVSAALFARVPLRPELTVLDFGAGTGLLTGRVAPRVSAILAVDVSPAMLEQLALKPELQGKVEPICHDLLEAPLGRQVGLIISAMAMHHVRDTAALLRALYAHLEEGGSVALADLEAEDGTFHPAGMEGVFHHGFEVGAFARALEAAGFVDVAVETACVVEKEGRRYPVFLATAKRP